VVKQSLNFPQSAISIVRRLSAAMHAARRCYIIYVRLSVCLSHTGIALKGLNRSSWNQRCTLSQDKTDAKRSWWNSSGVAPTVNYAPNIYVVEKNRGFS